MTKEEMTAALDAMLEQGNQLRASKLVPVLKELAKKEGGGGGSLEFANVVAKPEPYVSFNVFVEFGFTEEVYSKLCSGEYAGFVTEGGARYLIVATYPENADWGTPAGFAYCDNNGQVYDTKADYANETIKIEQLDGVSVVEISSLPESGSYSAQQMAEYGITKPIADSICGGYVVGLAVRSDGLGFYGVECAYYSIDPEYGNSYTTIVLRAWNDRYKIRFAENGSAVVSVESVNGGGSESGIITLLEDPQWGLDNPDTIDSLDDYFSEEDQQKLLSGQASSVRYSYEDNDIPLVDEYAVVKRGDNIWLIGRNLSGYNIWYDREEDNYICSGFNWMIGVRAPELSDLPDASITTMTDLENIGLNSDAIHRMSLGSLKTIRFAYADGQNNTITGAASVKYCVRVEDENGDSTYHLVFDWFGHSYSIVYTEQTDAVVITVS